MTHSPPVTLDDAALGRLVRKATAGIKGSASNFQKGTLTAAGLALVAVATELGSDSLNIDLNCTDGNQACWRLELRKVAP